MLSDKELSEIIDRADRIISNTNVGKITDRNRFLESFAFGQIVAYLITAKDRQSTPQQLNG